MPSRALVPCGKSGCSELVSGSGYCPAHAYLADAYRALHEASRPGSNRRGYDGRWKKYARRFLAANPLCADPFKRHVGVVTPATQVDHITPHKGDRRLFWDPTNHQPLCASCGGYKSSVEAGGRAESSTRQRFDQLVVGSISSTGGVVFPTRPRTTGTRHTRKSVQHTELQHTGRGVEISTPQSAYTVPPVSALSSQVCNSTGKNAREVSNARR